jgi:hypothetical protein
MFGIFKKDPLKKLNQQYRDLLEKATHAQRNGNIELFANLSAKADKVLKEIER